MLASLFVLTKINDLLDYMHLIGSSVAIFMEFLSFAVLPSRSKKMPIFCYLSQRMTQKISSEGRT